MIQEDMPQGSQGFAKPFQIGPWDARHSRAPQTEREGSLKRRMQFKHAGRHLKTCNLDEKRQW